MKPNLKNNFLKTTFLIAFFALVSFLPVKTHPANAWMAIQAAQYKQLLETIFETIKGLQLSIAKQAAISSLTSQVNRLVVGNSSSSILFITNWEDYLYKYPANETNRYMNDYLSKITAGRGQGTNYTASYEGFSSSTSGNYFQQLVASAKATTIEKETPKVTYEGDPSRMLEEGNFKNMNLWLSGVNNPLAFSINAEGEYQKKKAEQEKIAASKAVAYQGFIGSGEKAGVGVVITPGSVIKDAVSNVQNIGNQVVANAQHIPEILTAVVSQMITKTIQQGIGEAQRIVQKELDSVSEKTNGLISAQVRLNGPGAAYNYSPATSSAGSYYKPSANDGQTGQCVNRADGVSCNGGAGTCSSQLCWPKNSNVSGTVSRGGECTSTPQCQSGLSCLSCASAGAKCTGNICW